MRFLKPPMRLKNKNATRVIPLHPEIIRLGFINFVEQCKAQIKKDRSKDLRLFKNLKKNPARMGGVISNWWNGYKISTATKIDAVSPAIRSLSTAFAIE